MKKVSKLLLYLWLSAPFCVQGQMTIGSLADPHSGAVLELKSSNKGLLLPRISLNDVNVFQLEETTGSTADMAEGMIVYNTNESIADGSGKGVYLWDGSKWVVAFDGTGGNSGNKGGSGDIVINNGNSIPVIPSTGGSRSAILTTDCTTAGDWSFSLETGAAYATMENADLSAGTFDIVFSANESATPRAAVVRVTDACSYSKNFTFIQAPAATDPVTMETGTGLFSGRTCFDIAVANDNVNSCGSLAGRASQKTDFSVRTEQGVSAAPPYSGVQVYTFTPVGTVSNLRFMYVEEGSAVGRAIKSITPRADFSGNVFGASELIVEFKESLNTDLRGLSRRNGFKVYLYAIYNNAPFEGGTDVTVRLALNLQDCSCCGAKTSSTEWLNIMCFNLGADEVNGDPFTYSDYILGDLYQWGRIADGHQKRTSSTASGAVATANLDGRGQVKSTNNKYGKFITVTSGTYDWRTPQDHTLWGTGNQDATMSKTVNDPCPAGWKIPTQKQWAAIHASNGTWQWTGSGYKVGESLYLPAAGIRNGNGNLNNVGSYGYCWSSTVSSTDAYSLTFYSTNIDPAYNNNRSTGMSVRCVSE
ncbi:MAG: fibrobacter succinogenes major paralogous domain-containing protein [Bacteroidales bacterium]|nr:fibrobacter succinogenes major paralogous domain-containing protein [Bacteroidales bacterium]